MKRANTEVYDQFTKVKKDLKRKAKCLREVETKSKVRKTKAFERLTQKHERDVAVLHDVVAHSRCVYSPDENDDASAPVAVCSPTPNDSPETVTEYPPDIAKLNCSVNDAAGASKLNTG